MNIVYQPSRLLPLRGPLALVTVLACGAQLMVVLDGLIVNVALPEMRTGLNLSASAQQWIVNGYLITFGGLLLLAARAADLIGHRRLFLAGVTVFTLASVAGGLAHDATTMVTARLAQGVGAAALAPSSLSLLTMTHTGERRARALSIWSATSASAAALGLVLGGVITSGLGWRWVLLINLPVGVALWILAAAVLAPSPNIDRRPLDLPGAATVTFGAAALTYGISEASGRGWTATHVAATLLAAAILFTLFFLVERRSPVPLVPLSILRRRDVIVANTIVAILGAIMTATLYFLCLYQQQVLGHSPLRTGLALVPMSTVLALGAIVSKSLLPRLGTRRLIITGSLIMAAGLAWLAASLATPSDHNLSVLGPTSVWAAGASIVTMPCVALATADITTENAGLASGIVNTARHTGGAIGLATLATIANTATTHSDSTDTSHRVVHGYTVAITVAGVTALLVAVIALAARTNGTRGES